MAQNNIRPYGGQKYTEQETSDFIDEVKNRTDSVQNGYDSIDSLATKVKAIETGAITLGETSTTAYRGDRGKTSYDHSQETSGNPHSVTKTEVGLGNVDNTSDADKPVSTAQREAIGDLQTQLDAAIFESVKVYDSLADAQAVDPKPADGTVFQVSEATDSNNAGYYSFQSSEPGGTRFERYNLKPEDIGIETINAGTNILEELQGIPVTNTEIWGEGFLRNNGIPFAGSGWYYSKNFIKAYPGLYEVNIRLEGNARLIAYDANYNIVDVISNETNPTVYIFQIQLPASTEWIKISHNDVDTSYLRADFLQNANIPTNNVFTTPIFVNLKKEETKEELGFLRKAPGTNFLQELADSQITDTEIWGEGFLRDNGIPFAGSGWYYSKKYYRIEPGEYEMYILFSGNARVLLYNADYELVSNIENVSDPVAYYFPSVIIPENVRFIRISINTSNPSTTRINNKNEVIQKESPFSTTGGVKNNSTIPLNGKSIITTISRVFRDANPAKPRIPMVSFISDDGHVLNDDWYVPMLDSKEVKSSFAIITGRFGDPNYYTKERIVELSALGHDIAGHTHNHYYTGDLPLPEQEFELQRCKTELAAIGEKAEMFVAPFGSRTFDTDRIVRKYYRTDFISVDDSEIAAGTCANVPPIESYKLKRVKFDAGANEVSRLQVCKDAVDVAIATGGWLVFAIHPQYPEYQPSNNPSGYGERRQELSDLIDYIQSLEVPILTAKQAYNLYKNPVELGNVGLDTNYYVIGMDGTEEGNYLD